MAEKKRFSTKIAAVALAAAVLVGGGTFAYLQASTDEVENTFNSNQVTVDLKESGDQSYEVVPGTSETKDPTVYVNASVDAWVFVTVEDELVGIADWALAEGWSVLYGDKDDSFILYREVSGSDSEQTFPVISGNTVSYSAGLTNDDMDDWTSKTMTFQAYAIQKAGFDTAEAAWNQFANGMSVSETISKDANTVLNSPATVAMNGENTTVEFPKEIAAFAAADGKTAELTVSAVPILTANVDEAFDVETEIGSVGAIELKVKVNDIEVSQFTDEKGEPVPVTVTTYIAKGFTLDSALDTVSLKYIGEGSDPTLVSYDTETGKLVFTTTHFSTFAIGADQVAYLDRNNTAYLTLEEAVLVAEDGDTVTMLKNAEIGAVKIFTGITLDGANYTVTGNTDTRKASAYNSRPFFGFSGFELRLGLVKGEKADWSDATGSDTVARTCTIKNLTILDTDNKSAISIPTGDDTGKPNKGQQLNNEFTTVNIINVKAESFGHAAVEALHGTTNITDCRFIANDSKGAVGNVINIDGWAADYFITANIKDTYVAGALQKIDDWDWGGITVWDNAKVTVDGCELENCAQAIAEVSDPDEVYTNYLTVTNTKITNCEYCVDVYDWYNTTHNNITLGEGNYFEGWYPVVIEQYVDDSTFNVNITGGTYIATLPPDCEVADPAVQTVVGDEVTATVFNISITGGKFSSDPTEFLASGHTAAQSGSVWVVK